MARDSNRFRSKLTWILLAGCVIGVGGLGCGADETGQDYSGTWPAILGNTQGSFTFVVVGNTVTSLAWDFSYSASSGGSSCSITTTCPASGTCATPSSSRITGSGLSVSKSGDYEVTGTFSSASSASGEVNYTIVGSSALCDPTQTTTWTATKS